MRCPECQFENRDTAKFCEECGARLRQRCPSCGLEVTMGRKFCGECGHSLQQAGSQAKAKALPVSGERKRITVMFSDLSGYSRMTEQMDPEEVKEIMSRIFVEITRVVKKYDGFIGRFLGDAAMVLFGVPSSHEDDAVRAIRAAREIHTAVEALSLIHQAAVGHPLAMHTGINSGLVVLGELDSDNVADEITGDTVNLASRLCSLAKAGTILVGPETYRLSQDHFIFNRRPPVDVSLGKAGSTIGPETDRRAEAHFLFKRGALIEIKEKSSLIEPYEAVAPRDRPEGTRRLHGVRSELVGRASEMALLAEAVERLQQGQRTVFCISGDPGTGKTRLVEEFKATLDERQFQWLAAHAYGYTQNMPYAPLLDLLNRFWQIEEEDSPEAVHQKIELGVERLLTDPGEVPFVLGSLYALDLPGLANMSPEWWKAELFEAIRRLLEAAAESGPTVICLEDLHWADPPFVDLLRFILGNSTFPAIFLCVYRPPLKLFLGEQSAVEASCRRIHLEDLSPDEAQQMMESLLRTKVIPSELKPFIHEKTEGNPFYMEEVVNSLIESEILVRDGESWKLARTLRESDISPNIHGVIAARLDRLSIETKKILQEASVIGRNFLYIILEHITEIKERLQDCLTGLERLDLIRTKALQPELEYIFKHALTQEVVYNGLLKKERQAVHERIGRVVEELFRDRLPEIYEMLAFHYRQGKSVYKAVDYLVRSGEKSLRRYAVEESHQYFRDAYQMLMEKGTDDHGDKELLIDLLLKWAFVYYYSGDYRKLQDLLQRHMGLAETLTDKSRLGMFYAWLSCALWHREKTREAYDYLSQALKLGAETGDGLLVGYTYTWLTWICMELGRLDEAASFANKAQTLCRSGDMDHYIYFNSLAGLAYVHAHRGEKRKAFECGKILVEFGRQHANVRSMVMGYTFMGFSCMVGGDASAATSHFEEAIRVSADPWYSQFPKIALCYARIAHGDYQGLQEFLEQLIAFSEERGAEYVGSPGRLLLGAVLAAQGQLSRGMKLMEEVAASWLQSGNRFRYASSQLILGRIYGLMAQGSGKKKLSTLIRNTGFLIRNAPFADRKAVRYLGRAIEVGREIGAKDTTARAYLTLGLLHKAKHRHEQARQCLSLSAQIFEECEAGTYLAKAREALLSLS